MKKISNAIVLAISTVALAVAICPATASADSPSDVVESATTAEVEAATPNDSASDGATNEDEALPNDEDPVALASEAPASDATYAHSTNATSNGVTFTVQWNDSTTAGEATTFHVTQTGGSSNSKVRMDAPVYWDNGSGEVIADASRRGWMGCAYTLIGDSYDYSLEFTASGSYNVYFYFMDTDNNVGYLRTTEVWITVNDAGRPAVSSIVSSAVAQAKANTDGSDYSMALYLHDWLLDQLEYDNSYVWSSAESALTRGAGTCQAYTDAYTKLLNAAGIADSQIRDTADSHTWNAVKLDGAWYQVDCTWDDNEDTKYYGFDARHLYFAITDELMAVAHKGHTAIYSASGYATRSTSLTDNYYVRSGLAGTWADAYAARIQAQLDAKATSFSITSDNAANPPSIIGIQNAVVAYAMGQKEWKAADSTKVELSATSNVTTESSTKWTAVYQFEATYDDSEPSYSRPLPDGMYSIYSNLNQSKTLDVRMASNTDGANVQLWQDYGNRHQKVMLTYQGDGTYLISFVHSGKVMAAESLRDGANVSQTIFNGSNLQKWIIEECGSGYTIKSKAGNQWLNVRLANPKDGANIQTWSNGGVRETIFNFASTDEDALPNGRYAIKTALDSSKAIDIRMASQSDLANAQLWTDYGSANQTVDLRRQSDGTYVILFAHSQKALTAEAYKDGANVSQASYTGSNLQRWILKKGGSGFIVKVAAGNEYLNVRLANARDGANIQTWSNGGVRETIFLFQKR